MIERTKANKAGDCTVYIEVSSSGNNQKKELLEFQRQSKFMLIIGALKARQL
jgi:hypothetical protein